MGKICSYPGCQTGRYAERAKRRRMGLRQLSIFSIPKHMLLRWSETSGHCFSRTDFVCELHFSDDNIVREDRVKMPDGKTASIPRILPLLTADAVPIGVNNKDNVGLPEEIVPCNPLPEPSAERAVILTSCTSNNAIADLVPPTPGNVAPEEVSTLGEVEMEDRSNGFADHPLETSSETSSICSEADDDVRDFPDGFADPIEISFEENSSKSKNDLVAEEGEGRVFSMEMIIDQLKQTLLPELWCWAMNPSEESSVLFVLIDRHTSRTRLRVIVHNDLSVTIESIDTKATVRSRESMTSFERIIPFLRRVENIVLCCGVGVEEEARADNCSGFVEGTSYSKFVPTPRCTGCKKRRIILQNRGYRRKDAKARCARAKYVSKLRQRRYRRLEAKRFFGMIRNACGSNDHPDPTLFAQVFRLLCTYSLVKLPMVPSFGMITRMHIPLRRQARHISTKKKVKLNVVMDQEIYNKIENEELRPRKHPGRMNSKSMALPGWLGAVVQKLLQDMPNSTVIADSIKLANFLNSRHVPPEKSAVEAKYMEIRETLAMQRKLSDNPEEAVEINEAQEKRQCLRLLKTAIHSWSPVRYNKYASLLYLVGRSAQEYTVLCRIFNEISTRDKDFRPKSLLDFGSGVGTVVWATTSVWPKDIKEHMCVEVSTEMVTFAESIINDSDPKIDRVFYRQYVPLSNRTYDLVVSAYSLSELPNMETRLQTVAKLWEKTGQYLVIIEQGTNAGFHVINEARDFILHMKKAQREDSAESGSIFAPCPHEFRCPRYKTDNTPCNFESNYHTFSLTNVSTVKCERFSYVVFKKGDSADNTKNWPRIVRPVLVRSKHAICRMCTADGKLNEVIFTASKHGKWMYRCARSSRWGDRLPMETTIKPTEVEEKQEEEANEEIEKEEDTTEEKGECDK